VCVHACVCTNACIYQEIFEMMKMCSYISERLGVYIKTFMCTHQNFSPCIHYIYRMQWWDTHNITYI